MNCSLLTLQTDLGRIDTEPDGAPRYRELRERATKVDSGEAEVYVASIDDLMSIKRAAGRPQDLAHIAELETIKNLIQPANDISPSSE